MKTCLIISLFCSAWIAGPPGLWAQPYYNQEETFRKANGVWAIANYTGYNFNSTFPAPFASQLELRTNSLGSFELLGCKGSASVADPVTGELLFYTNGGKCWNRNHVVMTNGDSLLGNGSPSQFWPYTCVQGACVVPVIDHPGKYYLFSLAAPQNSQSPERLFYSVVDMSLNNGLGDIVATSKNILLSNDTAIGSGMIAIRGERCGELWLLLNEYSRLQFKAYHITEEGIDPNPVISNPSGAPGWVNHADAFVRSGLAVSPDRERIALSSAKIYNPDPDSTYGTVLCRFNPATGVVSDAIDVKNSGGNFLSAFSPDNTKLYVAGYFTGSAGFSATKRAIVQYDVSVYNTASIAASRIVVDEESNFDMDTLAIEYMRQYNGKIYLPWWCNIGVPPPYGEYSLSVIQSPNQPGTACDFQSAILGLGVPCSGHGRPNLPNELALPLLPDTLGRLVMDTVFCLPAETWDSMVLEAPPGYPGYVWDDGSTNVARTITETGTHWVGYKKENCTWQVDTYIVREVEIGFTLGEDKTVLFCDHPDAYVALQVNVPNAQYVWQDGSREPKYQVRREGIYWVQVEKDGCKATDSIMIRSVFLNLPDTVLCKGEAIAISLEVEEVPPGALLQWSTGSDEPAIIVIDAGMYWVNIIQPPCILSDTAEIRIEPCECSMGVPNAFSPNGDGVNDVFLPVIESGCVTRDYYLRIYNRYGENVFYSAHPEQGWDGNFKDKPADVGTYFYQVYFKGGRLQIPLQQHGDLVLIR